MAPEMIKQQPYDKTIDYYSLGILLYELLFGIPPFYSSDYNFEDLKTMILHKPISFPKNDLSTEVKDLILHLTEKDLRRRIGFSQGFFEIASHPWLSNINIESIRRKIIKPPINPNLYEINFDQEFIKKNVKVLDEVCSEDDGGKIGLYDKFSNFSFSIENKDNRFSINSVKSYNHLNEDFEMMSIPGKSNSEKLSYKYRPSKMRLKLFNEEFQEELEFLSNNSKFSTKYKIPQKNNIFEDNYEDIKAEKTPTIQKIPKSKEKHVGDILKNEELPFIDNDLSSIISSNILEKNKNDVIFKKDYEEMNDFDEELKKIDNELTRCFVMKPSSMEMKPDNESSYHTAIDENKDEGEINLTKVKRFMKFD